MEGEREREEEGGGDDRGSPPSKRTRRQRGEGEGSWEGKGVRVGEVDVIDLVGDDDENDDNQCSGGGGGGGGDSGSSGGEFEVSNHRRKRGLFGVAGESGGSVGNRPGSNLLGKGPIKRSKLRGTAYAGAPIPPTQTQKQKNDPLPTSPHPRIHSFRTRG